MKNYAVKYCPLPTLTLEVFMEKEYITNILEEIRNGIVDYNKLSGSGWAYYPKEVVIEKDGVKVVVAFIP